MGDDQASAEAVDLSLSYGVKAGARSAVDQCDFKAADADGWVGGWGVSAHG